MDVKQKTAAISTLLNLIFAILKFVMAGLSGSLVILAEAWHSLTDVFTSLLVYFSVSPRNSETGGYAEDKSKLKNRGNPLDNKIDWKNITLENWVSLIIGGLILFAAIGVASRIISKPPITISSPFAYGLLFLFFAGCSYVVSIFEVKIGKKYDSPALIADGLHSKSDMVGSLIAGFTMITIQLGINRLGINIDKIGAVIIIIFILIFSLETFINFWSALHGKHRWRDRIASGLISSAFEKQTWKAFSRNISHRVNWDHLSSETRIRVRQFSISLLALGALFLISFSCTVTIGPSQEGIRERLGRLVNRGHPLEPGFHMKLPWPLENIIKVDSRAIKSMNIGNTANPSAVALLWTKQHGTEESFLSAENYFFYPYIVLHYRIKDIFDYTYSFRKPEDLLNNTTHRLLTEIFSTKILFEIVTIYRSRMEEKIKKVIQAEMDALDTGLEIIAVNTKDIHPPVSVADSYEQVIAAMQVKEQKINQAVGYSNSTIPQNRGWAVKKKMQAKSYVLEKVANARGEAQRFLSRVSSILTYPSITMPMLYREAIKETMANKSIILVDPRTSLPDVWLKSGKPIFLESQF